MTDPYTESIGHDYWAVGLLDDGGGEAAPDWSKRVVFNSALPVGTSCTFGGWQQPLQSGNPQFNTGQNVKIAFKLNGTNCSGGVLRISVVKLEVNGFTPMPVTSLAQQDNVMDSNGPRNYYYDLVTSPPTLPGPT